MFQIGQLIVYGAEGVCRVDSIGVPDINGIDQDRTYYTLTPLYNDVKVFAPVDTSVLMRPVLTKKEAVNLVDQISAIKEEEYEDRNPQFLNHCYLATINSQKCSDLVQLIKTIYKKKQSADENRKTLGQVHRRYMKRAEELLYGELAVALEMPKNKVLGYIEKTLNELEAENHKKEYI